MKASNDDDAMDGDADKEPENPQEISDIEAQIEAEINGIAPINGTLNSSEEMGGAKDAAGVSTADETAVSDTTTTTLGQTTLKDQTTLVSDASHAIALQPVESSRVEC